VAVGYPAKRGVVAAASYEARRFGVRSAMLSTIVLRKCAENAFRADRTTLCNSCTPHFRISVVSRLGAFASSKNQGPAAFRRACAPQAQSTSRAISPNCGGESVRASATLKGMHA
jgi:nucleotidyltransferase/DNA polymerase involved in DNA repair